MHIGWALPLSDNFLFLSSLLPLTKFSQCSYHQWQHGLFLKGLGGGGAVITCCCFCLLSVLRYLGLVTRMNNKCEWARQQILMELFKQLCKTSDSQTLVKKQWKAHTHTTWLLYFQQFCPIKPFAGLLCKGARYPVDQLWKCTPFSN